MPGNTNSGRAGAKKLMMINVDNRPSEFTVKPPVKLHKLGKKYWKKIVPMLVEKGVLDDLDQFALDRLCQLYGVWMECRAKLHENGLTYETETDRGAKRFMERPELSIMQKAEKEIQQLERKFGLTPGDREKIKMHGQKKKRNRPGSSLNEYK